MQSNYTEFKGYKIINKLNILDLFSNYYLVTKDSKYYILRVFNEDLDITDEIIEKIKEITNDLKEHLCVIYEFGYEDKNYYQILEYPSYSSLTNYIREKLFINSRVNEDILKQILKELSSALNELNSNGIGILLFNSDSIFIRNISKLDLVFVSFNLPPLINEDIFFSKLISNYKSLLAPENLDNVFSFESDYYHLGKLIYKIFKNKEFNITDYEEIKYDASIPIDYKVLLLGLLAKDYKKRFSFDELSLFFDNNISLLIDRVSYITSIDYPYVKNIPFVNKFFNDDKELYLEFIKSNENFDLAFKFFFNYLINKLNLKDYKIFEEIKNELQNELLDESRDIDKIIFSLFISVKLKNFYLYNFLINIDLIKKSFIDPKNSLNYFFINYIDYLFNNSLKSYKNSIFYFYSIFSKLSSLSFNYLENLFYNIQNLALDLDFDFYSNYYHLKNKKDIFIKFLTDLFNNQLIVYKNFDIFNTKIDIDTLKDQKKFIFLPINYFQRLSSVYILPKEFKNLNNLDLKDYVNLVNWLFKNKSKLIRLSDSIKDKEKISSLDINSYEQLINSKKNNKTFSLRSILFIFISLFLFITIFWILVSNIKKLSILSYKNFNKDSNKNITINSTTTNSTTNVNFNTNSGVNSNLYNSNFVYSKLDLVKVRAFGGNSYEEFYNIYSFNNYFYLLGITNSFGFGSFDSFL
ncbi:MAG: hypothetical protein ACP5RD_08035, partial [bacterium]